MKVYVQFNTKQHTGGGKNFLAALSQEFAQRGVLAQSLPKADVILFNSHHHPMKVIWNRLVYPNKIFIHRVDGPMSAYTNRRDWRDVLARALNEWAADGTIWQSMWSRQANKWDQSKPTAVLRNAPNPIFFSAPEKKQTPGKKMKIMAHSWSSHPNKGLSDLLYLDRYLDFDRYQVDFWGPTVAAFTNIRQHPVAPLSEIARALREADVYVFTSRIEACSNALLEALASHTPVVAYDGSSNAEILTGGGELYTKPAQIAEQLETIRQSYAEYVTAAQTSPIEAVANQYLDFIKQAEVTKGGLLRLLRPIQCGTVVYSMAMVRFEGIKSLAKKRQPIARLLSAWRLTLFIQLGFRQQFKSVQPGDVTIDCGANIGDVTSRLAARGARVHAFEPHPQAFTKLQERFASVPEVTCYNQAVGRAAGKQKLYLHQNSADDPVKWSVGASFLPEKGNVNQDNFVEVETIDLAAFISGLGKRVKLLKIDVEGAEYGILRRLIESGTIHLIDSVLVETHEQKIPGLMPEHAAVVRLIKDQGLRNINLQWT